MAALFTITSYGNNTDAIQLMNGSRKCDIYIYTMEFYSAIRNNDMWFAGKWM
jgi:hypothetical protein